LRSKFDKNPDIRQYLVIAARPTNHYTTQLIGPFADELERVLRKLRNGGMPKPVESQQYAA
jgi:hypothetical protein